MSTQPTLLCIDDEENGLKMRKWLFETEGFQVFTALDGLTGIDLFKAHSIDAVILDYSMPKMDGIAVAETLKKLRSSVPIIMLSGYPSQRRQIEALTQSSQKAGLPRCCSQRRLPCFTSAATPTSSWMEGTLLS